MNIKHIFFDLDHTLWDFEKNSDLTFQKLFKDYNIDLDIHVFLKIYKPLNLKFWRLYREEKISKENLRYQRLKDAFDAVNYTVSDALIHTLADKYIAFLPLFDNVFEGTFEILEYLKTKYQLHIITNGFEEVQSLKMKSANLSSYFNKIVTSESVGVKKPNPRVFEHALKIAGANKENSIMIGDSIEADILGAVNFGMPAIYCDFDNKPLESEAYKSITSLLQLKQYL